MPQPTHQAHNSLNMINRIGARNMLVRSGHTTSPNLNTGPKAWVLQPSPIKKSMVYNILSIGGKRLAKGYVILSWPYMLDVGLLRDKTFGTLSMKNNFLQPWQPIKSVHIVILLHKIQMYHNEPCEGCARKYLSVLKPLAHIVVLLSGPIHLHLWWNPDVLSRLSTNLVGHPHPCLPYTTLNNRTDW